MFENDFVLAFDFGGTKLAVATADGAGALLLRDTVPTLPEGGAEAALFRAVQAGERIVSATREARGGELRAVGVATMGVTLEDRVHMAPNVPGWDRLAIPGTLRDAFGVDVRVENDVKAATSAELRWGALQGVDVGLYVNLGTGIAVALVAGGHVVRGAHGASGEIGYNLRSLHEEVGALHGRAPFEEYVGGGAIAARARDRLGPDCTPADLFRLVPVDPAARDVVESALAEVCYHITNLTIALDPERVVMGGGLMRAADYILPRVADHIDRFVPFPPAVVPAGLSLDSPLLGAVALAIEPDLVS